MRYKNALERKIYEIAKKPCGDKVIVEHNKVIEIEDASAHETASFTGPPKKEIDVVTAQIGSGLAVLISCKQYATAKAEPTAVQEWGAVVGAMNRYSARTHYLGLLVCPSGFTTGCEAWATSNNIALIPPLKGKQVEFGPETCVQMTGRVLRALRRRVAFPFDDLLHSAQFYEFAYDLTADFEGRDSQLRDRGARFVLLPFGWVSSFQELISTLLGTTILEIISTTECLGLRLSGGFLFVVRRNDIRFGRGTEADVSGAASIPECRKNINAELCSFESVKQLVIGKRLRTAGDMGTHFEFGITNNINLGFHDRFLHVVRTLNPADQHRL